MFGLPSEKGFKAIGMWFQGVGGWLKGKIRGKGKKTIFTLSSCRVGAWYAGRGALEKN
jgi:hypothetical protein